MGRSDRAITMIGQLDKNEEAARFYERSLAHRPGGEFLESRMRFKIRLGSIKKTKKIPTSSLSVRFCPGRTKTTLSCIVVFEEKALRGRKFQGEKAPIRP